MWFASSFRYSSFRVPLCFLIPRAVGAKNYFWECYESYPYITLSTSLNLSFHDDVTSTCLTGTHYLRFLLWMNHCDNHYPTECRNHHHRPTTATTLLTGEGLGSYARGSVYPLLRVSLAFGWEILWHPPTALGKNNQSRPFYEEECQNLGEWLLLPGEDDLINIQQTTHPATTNYGYFPIWIRID